MTALPNDPPNIGLYIHWPFCKAKCPYCDFNSHVRKTIHTERWATAYQSAIGYWAERLGKRQVSSIFFGGGTPSLMPPALVATILDAIIGQWPLAPNAEITLEANPTSVEAGHFAGYHAAGVNRISLGVQALDDRSLHFLGRQHSVTEALKALDIAQSTFDRVTFDLIYARAGQSLESWEKELTQALSFGTEHISLYQLTIEPGTPFAERFAAGGLEVLSDDDSADLFALTQDMTAAAGIPAYEISNHARDGAQSRHNLTYWRYQDYVGIGPGAHGRVTIDGQKLATVERRSPENWLSAIDAAGNGLSRETPVSAQEQAIESLMMGLRLKEGIDLSALEAQIGLKRAQIIDLTALQSLQDDGFIVLDDNRLSLTDTGWPLLNSITGALLAG